MAYAMVYNISAYCIIGVRNKSNRFSLKLELFRDSIHIYELCFKHKIFSSMIPKVANIYT